ncbi:hypothetical protein BH09PSE3_BH09PSE3_02250 [soil metagenome]
MGQGKLHWWERRVTVVALALVAMIPLLWPTIPPLVDLPGHMGRFRVELDGDGSTLRQFYNFHWALIGNLGVDLLIVPMAKIFGLELGVKLIVMAIPALTVVGMLWIAREVHGRIPPTALFALPLSYNVTFLFGFVNFSLAMALALLAFGLWLRLARQGRFRLRAVVFLAIAPIIWVAHTFGLGFLGVLAFSAEIVRQRDAGHDWPGSFVKAVLNCLMLAPPIIVMLAVGDGSASGGTGDWFNWVSKLQWIMLILHDRWHLLDAISLLIMVAMILFAIFDRRLCFARQLVVSALMLLVAFIILPRVMLGGSFADMRLAPFGLAVAILAIGYPERTDPRFLNALAVAGLIFCGARLALTTASLGIISARQERALAALDHLPVGSRMIAFTGRSWTNRMEHLAGMAIVRRRAFSNDQWNAAGMKLMSVTKNDASGFDSDPSQTVIANHTDEGNSVIPIDMALSHFPKASFDYLWLVNPPAYDVRLTKGMTPVWRDGNDALFRIDHR